MSCEIKTPWAGEDGILLLRNGKFVIWMEVEIVTFVVKGSPQLTVTLDYGWPSYSELIILTAV